MQLYEPGQAPRVTPAELEDMIVREDYFTAADGIIGKQLDRLPSTAHRTITICVLILKNGIKLVGSNTGAVYPENHVQQMGKELARKAALEQLWPMMGFMLANKRTQEMAE